MFDTTPTPYMLKGKKNEKWHAHLALSELADNAYGAARGNGTAVWMDWDSRTRILTVLDNGQGMDDIGRLHQFGNTIGTAPKDSGVYGSGGTQAILWLPRKVDVWTLRDGKVAHVQTIWNEKLYRAETFPQIDNSWKPATIANTPLPLWQLKHGTYIRMHVGHERAISPTTIRRELGLTYAPAIRQGKKLTWNGEPIAPTIDFADLTRTVNFSIGVQVKNEEDEEEVLWVDGAIGIIPDLPQERSRIHIGYAYRTIDTTKECFKSEDRHYTGVGVTGWLDLSDGWLPYISFSKDQIHNRSAWDALMAHVFTKIEPLLKSIAEEKKYLVLDNIKLSLQNVFDGNVTITVPSGPPEYPDGPVIDPDPPGPPHPPKPHDATEGDTHEGKDKIQSQIEIVMIDDKAMASLLCKADATTRSIEVYVNNDHPIVQKAIAAEPPNQEMLNMMVIQAIAGALVDEPEVEKQVLPRKIIARLNGTETPREREGLLTRVLADSARAVV